METHQTPLIKKKIHYDLLKKRPVDFRAWDKNLEKIIVDFSNYAGWETIERGNNAWEMDRYIKLQYTGLRDKNEKKIYEGDIVVIDSCRYVCESRLTEWSFEFRFWALPHKEWCDGSKREKQVIGNIYENPELIK